MRFGLTQKLFFKSKDGAYSKVTSREFFDSQVTLTHDEVAVARGFFGKNGIFIGNVKDGGLRAQKDFYLFDNATGSISAKPIQLNLVFPKPKKNELRLYLRASTFKPIDNPIWFIYTTGKKIVLGAMSENRWRMIGREDPDDENYIDQIYTGSDAPKYRTRAKGRIIVRNPKIALQSFKSAAHKCEVDSSHNLFTSRASGLPFLEAHHLIPLKYQRGYKSSLDIQQNVVALCPYCHRLIHHSTASETKDAIDILAEKHSDLFNLRKLAASDLYRLYNCEEID